VNLSCNQFIESGFRNSLAAPQKKSGTISEELKKNPQTPDQETNPYLQLISRLIQELMGETRGRRGRRTEMEQKTNRPETQERTRGAERRKEEDGEQNKLSTKPGKGEGGW
jgi:hypothetical protein